MMNGRGESDCHQTGKNGRKLYFEFTFDFLKYSTLVYVMLVSKVVVYSIVVV